MLASVGGHLCIEVLIPQTVDARARYILAEGAVDERASNRTHAGLRRYPRKSPRRRAIPEILHRGIIVQGDAVIEFLAGQRGLVRITKVTVVHGKCVAGVAVRDLSESAEVRGEASCKKEC